MDEVNEAQRAVVVRTSWTAAICVRWCGRIGSKKKTRRIAKGQHHSPDGRRLVWGAYLGEEGMKRGIRVKTSSYTRHHVNITMAQAKAVSNYTNSIRQHGKPPTTVTTKRCCWTPLASWCQKALAKTCSHQGRQDLHAGPVAGALNGITRNTVFHIAAGPRPGDQEKRITRDELYICDELFFTGTAAEVTPIRELDRIQIGACAARITEKIRPRSRHRQRLQSEVCALADRRAFASPVQERLAATGPTPVSTNGGSRQSRSYNTDLLLRAFDDCAHDHDRRRRPRHRQSDLRSSRPTAVFCPELKMVHGQRIRRYLDVVTTGEGRVPYCGTKYVLDGPAPHGH